MISNDVGMKIMVVCVCVFTNNANKNQSNNEKKMI